METEKRMQTYKIKFLSTKITSYTGIYHAKRFTFIEVNLHQYGSALQ